MLARVSPLQFIPISIAAMVLLAAPGALALDGIDISDSGPETLTDATETDAGTCPRLTQIKYPFIDCEQDDLGNVVLKDYGSPGWSLEGRVPKGFPFTDGEGYWGPDR
jgi:hypothetical protein